MSGETVKPKSVRERLGLSKTHEQTFEQWRRGQDEIDMLTGVMTPDEWWYRNCAARGEAGKESK